MSFFDKNYGHLVPINPENTKSKDWVILLEASTIVGPSPDLLRVASTTQEKKIVWRFKPWSSQPFLVGGIQSTNSRTVFLSSTLQIRQRQQIGAATR